MRDPASIVAWYRIHPARHGAQLALLAKLRPQFAAAIKTAGQLIRSARG